ncbi:MAG TPA: DUF1801 domain-containing protein [Rudaea sp.]|jgi:hypothetical protein|nr:DUF1801 domain-containing protein [Rudaea sp.]
MAENKTKATASGVEGYIEAIGDESRRKDCRALAKLMARATKREPVMWGTSIVGFGSYHYKYDSGREGDSCLVGFSSRKGDISIYLTASFPGREELLARLGKHKLAKACLYVRSLSDIDAKVLEQLVAGSAEARRRHATTQDRG